MPVAHLFNERLSQFGKPLKWVWFHTVPCVLKLSALYYDSVHCSHISHVWHGPCSPLRSASFTLTCPVCQPLANAVINNRRRIIKFMTRVLIFGCVHQQRPWLSTSCASPYFFRLILNMTRVGRELVFGSMKFCVIASFQSWSLEGIAFKSTSTVASSDIMIGDRINLA